MEINELQKLWSKQQQQLNAQKKLNKKLITELIKNKTTWLAPKTTAFICLFIFFIVYTIFAIIIGKLTWAWVIIVMCVYGIYNVLWQHNFRNRINKIEGGLIGMERNLINYRKQYNRSKRYTLIILPFYLIWFGWFIHNTIGIGIISTLILLTSTLILCLVIYHFRNKKTYTALQELENCLKELKDLEKED